MFLKVIFSQACVKNSIHGGGGISPGRQAPFLDRHPPSPGRHPQAETPEADSPADVILNLLIFNDTPLPYMSFYFISGRSKGGTHPARPPNA